MHLVDNLPTSPRGGGKGVACLRGQPSPSYREIPKACHCEGACARGNLLLLSKILQNFHWYREIPTPVSDRLGMTKGRVIDPPF